MESDKTMLWSMMGLVSLQSKTLPTYLNQLYQLWRRYRDNLSAFSHIEVPEMEESSMRSVNEIYRSVGTYLSKLEATANAPLVSLTRPRRNDNLAFSLPSNHTVKDEFQGAQIWWTHEVRTDENEGRGAGNTERKYILKISNKDRARVLQSYIDHISDFAHELKRRKRERKLFCNTDPGDIDFRPRWSSVAFKHPSTFETLALDPLLKERVKKDLDCFQQSREFYRKTGRAWKRGYLLYGPAGTGKSSLIAAIANYMHYDVYDLELTKVSDNSALRELLLGTASKSVLVIEDIDCAANLPEKAMCRKPSESQSEKKTTGIQRVTLSGLLNFADGLWSSCGEERIMIFTTNHKNKLDPALLRSGRMDMHILLSYCGFPAFKQLVHNYLDIEDHKLFASVEEKMQMGGRLTPADICEILIQNQSDRDSAIKAVIAALESSNHGSPALDAGTTSESESEISDTSEDEEEESSSSSSEEEEK